MTTDLRKEFPKSIVIGKKKDGTDKIRKYTLKQMSADNTLDCLPILGEMFGVSLFTIVSNAIADGNLSDIQSQLSSKLFNPKNKEAITEFFKMWQGNAEGVKTMLRLMLKDGYYESETYNEDNEPVVTTKPIVYEEFTADDLIIIGKLFIFGIMEVNFRRFFEQLTTAQDSAETIS